MDRRLCLVPDGDQPDEERMTLAMAASFFVLLLCRRRRPRQVPAVFVYAPITLRARNGHRGGERLTEPKSGVSSANVIPFRRTQAAHR
jgi:hypothetical protein